MMKEQEYDIIGETADKGKKAGYWDAAIGLQKVDGLEPSEYLRDLAGKNIEGLVSYEEVEQLLYSKYREESLEEKNLRLKESDLVSARIASILDNSSFPLIPQSLKTIHGVLFKDIYLPAGKFREYNISKPEPILNGRSVVYADYRSLKDTLAYDMGEEKENSYKDYTPEKIVNRISKFTSSIWQVHPFGEGNTRTTAVFMECYLRSMGYQVNNEMFKNHSLYFRNALVRSNYANLSEGIMVNNDPLNQFFRNLMCGEKEPLRNRDLLLLDCFSEEFQERVQTEQKNRITRNLQEELER